MNIGRSGLPTISEQTLNLLKYLKKCKDAGDVFVHVHISDGRKQRGLKTLVRHDFAFASAGLDGVRYTITGRGERALERYCTKRRRGKPRTPVCARCGERPKLETKYKYSYCRECYADYSRKQYEKRRLAGEKRAPKQRHHPLCPKCRERPKSDMGTYTGYCQPCRLQIAREAYYRKKLRALNDRLQNLSYRKGQSS